MTHNGVERDVRFEPLRPASRSQIIAGLLLGPVLWLVALILVAVLFEYTRAIEIGLLITIGAFVVSLAVLVLIRRGRIRQERRYVDGS